MKKASLTPVVQSQLQNALRDLAQLAKKYHLSYMSEGEGAILVENVEDLMWFELYDHPDDGEEEPVSVWAHETSEATPEGFHYVKSVTKPD